MSKEKKHYKILTIVKFKQAYTLKILHIPFSPLFFTNKDLSQYGNLIEPDSLKQFGTLYEINLLIIIVLDH